MPRSRSYGFHPKLSHALNDRSDSWMNNFAITWTESGWDAWLHATLWPCTCPCCWSHSIAVPGRCVIYYAMDWVWMFRLMSLLFADVVIFIFNAFFFILLSCFILACWLRFRYWIHLLFVDFDSVILLFTCIRWHGFNIFLTFYQNFSP